MSPMSASLSIPPSTDIHAVVSVGMKARRTAIGRGLETGYGVNRGLSILRGDRQAVSTLCDFFIPRESECRRIIASDDASDLFEVAVRSPVVQSWLLHGGDGMMAMALSARNLFLGLGDVMDAQG